jgi:hypothetical protein
MEVTTTNNYSFPNLDYQKNIRMPASGETGTPANISKRSDYSYDDVMMNLEDVKNFFFMLIGGSLAKVSADDMKGKNINAMA